MLQLHFGRTVGAFAVAPGPTFGPFETFRFERDQLHTSRMGSCIARFDAHGWDASGVACNGFHLVGVGQIHFESATGECSRPCGPFADIMGLDALIRVGSGRLFASFLATKRLWHAYAVGGDWPIMVLTALPHRAGDPSWGSRRL